MCYRPLGSEFRPRERALGQPTALASPPRAVMDDEQRSAKTDEASDHEPDKEDESRCDVFPFMQLPDDMRARALEYLLSASEACHDPWAARPSACPTPPRRRSTRSSSTRGTSKPCAKTSPGSYGSWNGGLRNRPRGSKEFGGLPILTTGLGSRGRERTCSRIVASARDRGAR